MNELKEIMFKEEFLKNIVEEALNLKVDEFSIISRDSKRFRLSIDLNAVSNGKKYYIELLFTNYVGAEEMKHLLDIDNTDKYNDSQFVLLCLMFDNRDIETKYIIANPEDVTDLYIDNFEVRMINLSKVNEFYYSNNLNKYRYISTLCLNSFDDLSNHLLCNNSEIIDINNKLKELNIGKNFREVLTIKDKNEREKEKVYYKGYFDGIDEVTRKVVIKLWLHNFFFEEISNILSMSKDKVEKIIDDFVIG